MADNSSDYISLVDCKKGYLYKLHSRNLDYGVYDGEEGFIGIREKFGDRYLFTEYHWDQGAPYGTVRPIEEIEKIPDTLILKCYLRDIEQSSGREVKWDEAFKGWIFIDDGSGWVYKKDNPILAVHNIELFKYLEKFEKPF